MYRAPTRPLSVLVVDGYLDSAASLAFLLDLEGFAAQAALTGGEAVAVAVADPPDVVILEPRTPGGGWELVRRLGVKVAGKRPLLVVLTTDTTAAGRGAADAVGIDLYLVKPIDPAILVAVLRRFERVIGVSVRTAAGAIDSPRSHMAVPGKLRECPTGRAAVCV